MTVSVLVPWRGDGGGPRDRAWEYVQAWWATEHPDWEVVTGTCPDGPWCKGAAVADAASRASGNTFVVTDADVVSSGVGQAVAAVQRGEARWAVPHRRVFRLVGIATVGVLAGEPFPEPAAGHVRAGTGRHRRLPVESPIGEAYTGAPGGGIVVLDRRTYAEVPVDPRFTGWGQEDTAWARALAVIAGPPWRGSADLWHLWHPPQARVSRVVGSDESMALYRRYRAAGTAEQMRALLDEVR